MASMASRPPPLPPTADGGETRPYQNQQQYNQHCAFPHAYAYVWLAHDGCYYCYGSDGTIYELVPRTHPHRPAHRPSSSWYAAKDQPRFERWKKRFRSALAAIGDVNFTLLPRAMELAKVEAHNMKLQDPLLEDIVRRCKRDAEEAGTTFSPPATATPAPSTLNASESASRITVMFRKSPSLLP